MLATQGNTPIAYLLSFGGKLWLFQRPSSCFRLLAEDVEAKALIVSDFSICDKQNIVQVVAFYIYMLTTNEEISKIEKTYL